jgi:hypothetical protein
LVKISTNRKRDEKIRGVSHLKARISYKRNICPIPIIEFNTIWSSYRVHEGFLECPWGNRESV